MAHMLLICMMLMQVIGPLLGLETMGDANRAFAYFFTMDTRNVPRDAWTMGNLVRNSMVCDFEAVTFCQRKDGTKRNLVVSFILAYMIYVVSSWVLDTAMITKIISPMWKNIMLLILVPWIGFQLAYGVGPTCFPLVPTCILQDAVLYVQSMMPVKVVWPNSVQKFAGCVDIVGNETLMMQTRNVSGNISAMKRENCLVPCRGAPFYFRSWESSVSWMACSLFPGIWKDVNNFPWPHSLIGMPGELQEALHNHSRVINASYFPGDEAMDLWHGHQFCFFMTLGQALPYLILALVIVMGALQLVKMPFAMVAAAVQFVWQAIAFTHSAE